MVDWSLILTLAVILFATLIGSFLRSRQRDRCLRDFHEFHITVEAKDGRVAWGTMYLSATGFELMYRSDVQDDKHLETSYVVYKDEYDDIQALYRYASDLEPTMAKRRATEVRRAFHPRLPRRMARSLRNFMNTATDSLGEAVGVVIGTVRKPAASVITDTSEVYLRDISKHIIGYVGTDYDPLLERYIGTRVVMEVVENGEVHEHVGIFKDYSAQFLEILDVYYPLPEQIDVKPGGEHSLAENVSVTVQEGQLRVRNKGDLPVYVEKVAVVDQVKELSAIVDGGEEIVLHVDHGDGEVTVHLRVARRLDMIVPRSHALVRHRAERYDPDTIFDIGRSLVNMIDEDNEIERLQQVLRYTPHDAPSAAKLGEIYFRRNQFDEAERWLTQAYRHRRHLPDDGNRVAQDLRMLQRRRGDQVRRSKFEALLAEEIAEQRDGQAPATEIKVQR